MFKRKSNNAAPLLAFPAGRKRKSIVALDLDGETLRVAHAAGQGSSAKITRLESAPFDLAPDKRDQAAVFGAALKKSLDSLRTKPKEVVIALARSQVVLRPLQVPMVADVRELASIINFQIAKDLPFRIEDAAVDFKVLRAIDVPASGEGAEPQKRLEVLVGAVRADVVEFYREAAKAAGTKLVGLGLRSIAAAHYAIRCVENDAPFLLVNVRNDEVTLEIISQGKLVFSRAAVIERENLIKTLQIEIVRSLHTFEGGGGHQPIQKVIVAGGTSAEAEIASALATSLNVPAQVLEPSACIDIRKLDRAEAANSIAVMGLALSTLDTSGLLIDFANPKKPAVQRNTQRTKSLLLAAAAIVLLFTLFGVRAHLIKKRLQVKDQVQAQLDDANTKVKIYKSGQVQARAVNTWIADEQNWLDHLAYLSAILPPADQIYVSALATTPQHVRFSVLSKTGELLAELDKKLRAAGYEVKPLSITPVNDKQGYNFRTQVELTIPRKMKPDISKIKPPARPADDASLEQASANRRGKGGKGAS